VLVEKPLDCHPPWYQSGSGGIVKTTSSRSRATSFSASRACQASTYRVSSVAVCSVSTRSPLRGLGPELKALIEVLARCNALFTDGTLASSRSAVSLAPNPS
jgi:hypothetical protein